MGEANQNPKAMFFQAAPPRFQYQVGPMLRLETMLKPGRLAVTKKDEYRCEDGVHSVKVEDGTWEKVDGVEQVWMVEEHGAIPEEWFCCAVMVSVAMSDNVSVGGKVKRQLMHTNMTLGVVEYTEVKKMESALRFGI